MGIRFPNDGSVDSDDGVDQLLANRGNWDARAPIHAASEFYGNHDSSYWFAPFEWDVLGDVRDRDVLHLQHIAVPRQSNSPSAGQPRSV